VLVAVGAAALLYSIVDIAIVEPRWAHASRSYPDFVDAQGTPLRLTIDAIVLGAGAALAAGGIVRWVNVARRAPVSGVSLVGGAGRGGGMLGVAGSF
jgi:hypothetical protein